MRRLVPVTRLTPRSVAPLALGSGLLLLFVACARQGSIPGGPQDRVPPIVVSTEPEGFAVLPEGFGGPVKIRFNERVSERSGSGSLVGAVVVSPNAGEVSVSHKRDGIEVSQAGGFPPGRVYRVTVLPRLQDMFQNSMREPFELVFSTGPDFSPGVVAGAITDRITGAPVAGRVEVVPEGDSVPTWTFANQDGVFAIRYLAQGNYRLTAYEDRNANGEVDFSESQGGLPVAVSTAGDTSIVQVEVLMPDTTPAVLASIQVVDSVTLLATFDDYMDPDVRQDRAAAALSRGGGGAPAAERVLLPHDWEAIYRPVVPDDEAALTPGADEEPPLPGDRPEPPLPGDRPEPPLPGDTPDPRAGPAFADPNAEGVEPRPDQKLYIRLQLPLEVGVPYTVTMEGVININGVRGGGGEVEVIREPDLLPPAQDTLVAPNDTLGADSLGVDTLVVDSMTVANLSSDKLPVGTLSAARPPVAVLGRR